MSDFKLYDHGLNRKAAQLEVETLATVGRMAADHPLLFLVEDIYKKLEALADAENETRQVVQAEADKAYMAKNGPPPVIPNPNPKTDNPLTGDYYR